MKLKNVMLDLETLGTGNRAAVVAIGACVFDPHVEGLIHADQQFYCAITPESAIAAGLEVDGSTVSWWMQQSAEARAKTFPTEGALDIYSAMSRFLGFMEPLGRDAAVWGNGATFDNIVIRSAFKAVKLPVPWSFRMDKCYRTVANLLPKAEQPAFTRHGTAHSALDDAITQALHLQKVFKALGL